MLIEYFREFIVLAEKLNFTAASEALHLTQPALSNHLRTLEKEIGVTLLDRSPSKGARLTKAGRIVYQQAEGLVRAYDEMISDAKKTQNAISGSLVFQLPRSELCADIIKILRNFMSKNPTIDVDIRAWIPADSFDEFDAGRIDCGFIGQLVGEYSELAECDDCLLFPVAQSELLVYVQKDNPYLRNGTFPLEDLSRVNIAIQANQKNRMWSYLVNQVCKSLSVEPNVVQRYGDSAEDMFLSSLRVEDVVIASESSKDMLSFSVLNDRIFVPFDPPVMGITHFFVRKAGDNEALTCFISYLEQYWADLD